MRPLRNYAAFVVVATGLWFNASTAQAAIIISFDVTPQGAPDASVDVALQISGLVDLAAPSLGTFDLDISFDPAVLHPPTVVFGDPVLGDQLDLFALGAISLATPAPGAVNLFELSLDTVADLNALQAGAFTLATLTFAPRSTGTSFVNASINALGDALGDPLDATVVPATVTVDVTQVPEPHALVLLAAGLGAFAFRRRRYIAGLRSLA